MMDLGKISQRGIGKIELLIILSILAVLASILYPNYMNSAARGPMMACQSNLRTLSGAIDLYVEAHEGQYPSSLDQLVPEYLEAPLLCQGTDTYSSSYQIRSVAKESVEGGERKAVSVHCRGDNHSWYLEPNMPCWDSERVEVMSRPQQKNPFVSGEATEP